MSEKSERSKVSTNALMLAELALNWTEVARRSAKEWSSCIGRSESSVRSTPTWNRLCSRRQVEKGEVTVANPPEVKMTERWLAKNQIKGHWRHYIAAARLWSIEVDDQHKNIAFYLGQLCQYDPPQEEIEGLIYEEFGLLPAVVGLNQLEEMLAELVNKLKLQVEAAESKNGGEPADSGRDEKDWEYRERRKPERPYLGIKYLYGEYDIEKDEPKRYCDRHRIGIEENRKKNPEKRSRGYVYKWDLIVAIQKEKGVEI